MGCTPLVLWMPFALLLGAGCARPLEIFRDDRGDFERYHSWAWVPGSPRTIDAPPPYRIGLDRDLARLVERELARRGFVRVLEAADLHVGSYLRVKREVAIVLETGAMQTLSSLHSSPSYEVQSAVRRTEVYERTVLIVFAVDSRSGETVWKGRREERSAAQSVPHIDDTVAALLAHFPPAARPAPPAPGIEPPRGEPSDFSGVGRWAPRAGAQREPDSPSWAPSFSLARWSIQVAASERVSSKRVAWAK